MTLRRPFRVTLLLWLVLILTAYSLIRLSAALRWWDAMQEFGSRLSVEYLLVTGAGWGVVGGALAWGIFTRKAWARVAVFRSVCVWVIQYWLERIFFQTVRTNLGFSIVVFLIAITITALCTFHSSTTHFFTTSEDHGQPD